MSDDNKNREAWFELLFSFFPHRWLDRRLDGTKKLFDGLSGVFGYAQGFSDKLDENSIVMTALEAIPDYEREYGIKTEPNLTIEQRRNQILAKKRMMDSPTKIADVQRIANAFNLDVYVMNYFSEYAQTVFLEFKSGYLYDAVTIELCKKMLEEAKRAHIASEYIVTCTVNSDFYIAPVFTVNKLYIFDFERSEAL